MCAFNIPVLSASPMHPQPQDTHNGFTLIETIVIVLVIGILSAIAAPSFLSWVRNKEVDDALVQVVGALKEAQGEALRVGKGCTVTIDPAARVIRASVRGSSPPENCLPTGNRNFAQSNPNIEINTDFDPTNELIFTYRKTTPNTGVVVLSQPDASRQRCVVVSENLGLMRTGYYQGNPASPVTNNCNRNP